VPTKAGEAALVQARAIRIHLINLEGSLQGRDARPEGRVVVTTSDGLGAVFIPRLLAQVGQQYPNITFELRIDNHVTDLTEREVDVAIRPARKLAGQLTGRRVAQLGFALYATPDYLAQYPVLDPRAPNLTGHDLCSMLAPMTHYSVGEWLERHGKGARTSFASNQFTAMQGWALAGGGLVVLPCIVGDDTKGLIRATAPIEAMTVGLWLCTHPHIRKIARVRVVLDALATLVAAQLPALRGVTR
jgi:DNA-binding transcriptional LysR family regulator